MVSARGSYKQPDGKLISATIAAESLATPVISEVSFDGDFFADDDLGGDASLTPVEHALSGLPLTWSLQDYQERIAAAIPANLHLEGTDARALALAVRRAAGKLVGEQAQESVASEAGTGKKPGLPQDAFDTGNLTSSNLSWDELKRRWNSLDLAIVEPQTSAQQPFEPAMQMAVDEVIAERTRKGEMPALIRFWEWASPAVIIGLFQSLSAEVNMQAARERGITVVRRITGGGAMFVEPGNTITYSLTVPRDFIEGLNSEDAYRLCEAWAIGALRSVGIKAAHAPLNDVVSPAGKIGGAAQRRYPKSEAGAGVPGSVLPGAVLHHTTMAYDIDAVAMTQVLRPHQEKLAAHAVKSAAKRVDPMKSQSGMSRREIMEAMARYAHEFVPGLRSYQLPEDVLKEARELAQSKYSNPQWTGRIA
ncbi:lipoate--protein ligase family protein [Aeriscardovia aeriphila]|uniref:Lipoate-protein ligase A n=1 Tax=Aeriscardovia aeriphila TaxID=218139 RepID=A0A261F7Y9_9BIFI|nr:biotin/lipoate A/B protein ligase family protein [Aeriscardovia aeriphila]NYI25196.1 lipoate-protein ligase A [Aeriscardovia aeriphila]OZG55257.1 lipoate-protein ligase A [Aeriscardovia aeriphila]